MTKLDIKQYLEKIYNIPVIHINTYNKMGKNHTFSLYTKYALSYIIFNSSQGKTKTLPNHYVTKEPDSKIAFVTLV